MKTVPPPSVSMAAAVKPVSALQLLQQERERRRRLQGQQGTATITTNTAASRISHNNNSWSTTTGTTATNDTYDESYTPPLPLLCLAQNPIFFLPIGITEVAGAAGVGKTQLALSLCADCVTTSSSSPSTTNGNSSSYNNNNNNCKAVYISLGGSNSFLQTVSKRLYRMLEARMDDTVTPTVPAATTTTTTTSHHGTRRKLDDHWSSSIYQSLSRIFVRWIRNSDELMELLQTSLPRLLKLHPTISLVVLDGIANLFRIHDEHNDDDGGDDDTENHHDGNNPSTNRPHEYRPNHHHRLNPWHHRAVLFFQISNLCRALSSTFLVPFVVINGATTRINTNVRSHIAAGGGIMTTDTVVEPALGLAWAQCVNCRFFVTRGHQPQQEVQQQQQQQQTVKGAEDDESRQPLRTRMTSARDDGNNRSKNDDPLHRPMDNPRQSFMVPTNIVCRQIRCLKSPHISPNRSVWDFWVDTRGVHPILKQSSPF